MAENLTLPGLFDGFEPPPTAPPSQPKPRARTQPLGPVEPPRAPTAAYAAMLKVIPRVELDFPGNSRTAPVPYQLVDGTPRGPKVGKARGKLSKIDYAAMLGKAHGAPVFGPTGAVFWDYRPRASSKATGYRIECEGGSDPDAAGEHGCGDSRTIKGAREIAQAHARAWGKPAKIYSRTRQRTGQLVETVTVDLEKTSLRDLEAIASEGAASLEKLRKRSRAAVTQIEVSQARYAVDAKKRWLDQVSTALVKATKRIESLERGHDEPPPPKARATAKPKAGAKRTWTTRPPGEILTPWEKRGKSIVAHKWPGGLNQGAYEIRKETIYEAGERPGTSKKVRDVYRVYWMPERSREPHSFLNELGNAVHRSFNDYGGVPVGVAPDSWQTIEQAKVVALRHAQHDLPVVEALPVPEKPTLGKWKPTGWYPESEIRYFDLAKNPHKPGLEKYADWVVDAFPWKVWGEGSPAFYAKPDDKYMDPAYRYSVIIRAPDDPERPSREAARSEGLGYGQVWKNLKIEPVHKIRGAILEATADGRPRTWNRITVEAFGISADVVPERVARILGELVGEQKLAFAVRDNGGFLFWNDAIWRKAHGNASKPGKPRASKVPKPKAKRKAKPKGRATAPPVSPIGLLLVNAFRWGLDEPDTSRGDAVEAILKRDGLDPATLDNLLRYTGQDLMALLHASNDRELLRATDKPVSYWVDAIEAASRVSKERRPAAPKPAPVEWERIGYPEEQRVLEQAGWKTWTERRDSDLYPKSMAGKTVLRTETPPEETIDAIQFREWIRPYKETPGKWSEPAYIAARSSKVPGRWQLTWFKDGEPVGDSERDTLAELVELARGEGAYVTQVVTRGPAKPSKPKRPAKPKAPRKPRRTKAPSIMDQILGAAPPAVVLPQGDLPSAYRGKKLSSSQTEAAQLDGWLDAHYPDLVKRVEYLVREHQALVVINTSGGKDSQAMFLYLTRDLKLPKGNVLVVHADLPGADWPGTTEWVRKTSAPYPVEIVRSELTFDEKIRQRGKFPDAARRFCTSDLKRGPIQKLIRSELCKRAGLEPGCSKLPLTSQRIVINAMGMRAQESTGRSKLSPWTVDLKQTAANRLVFNWLPVHAWTHDRVFSSIEKHGQTPFWIYGRTPADRKRLVAAGSVGEDGKPRPMSRMSCQFCILASAGDQLTAAMLAPQRAQEICSLERLTGHTMKAKVRKRKGKPDEVIQQPMSQTVEKARQIQEKGIRSAGLRVLA